MSETRPCYYCEEQFPSEQLTTIHDEDCGFEENGECPCPLEWEACPSHLPAFEYSPNTPCGRCGLAMGREVHEEDSMPTHINCCHNCGVSVEMRSEN